MPINRNSLLAFFAQLSMIVLLPLLAGGDDRTRAAAPEALQRIKQLINALAERQVAQNDAVEGSEEMLPKRPPEAKPHHSELSVNDPDKYYQGDVELSETQVQILEDDILSQLQPTDTRDGTMKKRRRRKVGKEPLYKRWDNKRPINYGFAPTVPETTRQKVRQALQIWQDHTCLRFLEDGPDVDRLEFFDGGGCSSFVGRIGGTQGISIATPGCDIVGIISHEVAHVLGLFHEQARPDQQHNIAVHWNNIPVSRWNNFQPVTDRQSDTFELPYDAGSVMHYAAYGFAVDPYRPTISTIDRNLQTTIGQRAGPSFLDVEAINTAYGCKQRCPKINCMHGGYANPNDCLRCLCPIGFTGSRCEELRYSPCGAQIIASTDPVVLTSPDFPEYFPKNVSCYWLIKAPPGGNVYLEFTESFHYECEDTCDKSFVEVNVGRDFRSTGYRFCCSSIPADTYRSHANEMLLMHFAWGERSRGFQAKVWSNKNFPVTAKKEKVEKTMPEIVTPTTAPLLTSTIPSTTTARVIKPKTTKKPNRLPVASTPTTKLIPSTMVSSTEPTRATTTSATTTTEPQLVTLIGPAACNCGLWSEWQGPCNQQCGGCGKRSRRRICQQENCQKEEKRTCNFNACPSGTNFLFNNGEFHVLWKGCCIGLFRADDVCSGLDSNQNTFLKIFTSLLSAMDHGNSTTPRRQLADKLSD